LRRVGLASQHKVEGTRGFVDRCAANCQSPGHAEMEATPGMRIYSLDKLTYRRRVYGRFSQSVPWHCGWRRFGSQRSQQCARPQLRVMADTPTGLSRILHPVTGAIFGLSYVGRGGDDDEMIAKETIAKRCSGQPPMTEARHGVPTREPTWFALPDVSGFWAVAFATPKAGWLVARTAAF